MFVTIIIGVIIFVVAGFLLKIAVRILFYIFLIAALIWGFQYFSSNKADVNTSKNDVDTISRTISTQLETWHNNQLQPIYAQINKYAEVAGKSLSQITPQDIVTLGDNHPEVHSIPGFDQVEVQAKLIIELQKQKQAAEDKYKQLQDKFHF